MVLGWALAWLGCIPTNCQQLQSIFNNSMETNPTLKCAPVGFLVLSHSLNCSKLLTSMVQYFWDSFDLLWLSQLTNKCVCWKWCMVQDCQVDSFWLVYNNHWKEKTTSCLHKPGMHWAQPYKVGSALCAPGSSEVFSTWLNWAPVLLIYAQSVVSFLDSVAFASSEPYNFSLVYLCWNKIATNFKIP